MAYESCGAWRKSSVALAASVVARVFICESTSSNWEGGRVLRVLEIASGQLRPCGSSIPSGRAGIEEFVDRAGGGIEPPFVRGSCIGNGIGGG